jgi:hypothetical protein
MQTHHKQPSFISVPTSPERERFGERQMNFSRFAWQRWRIRLGVGLNSSRFSQRLTFAHEQMLTR